MPREYTPRGFIIYDKFNDSRNSLIRVQESSNASNSFVWIFCKRNENDDSPHLNVEQAKRLITALQEFVNEKESFLNESL